MLMKHKCMIIVSLHTMLFFTWVYFSKGNVNLFLIGSDLFILSASVLSMLWLYKKYKLSANGFKQFWLLLIAAIGCTFISEIICLYYRWFLGVELPYPSLADVFWLLQNIFFIIALIVNKKVLENYYPVHKFLIDILIIMTIASVLSWNYLIGPNLSFYPGALYSSIVSIAYPITNLMVLFVTVSLYFVTQSEVNKTVLNYLGISFLFKIFADSVYVLEFMNNSFIDTDVWVAPLWSISIFLIGHTAWLTDRNGEFVSMEPNNKQRQQSNLYLYTSVIILFGLADSFSSHGNWRQFATHFIFLLIFIKLVLTLSENKRLSTDLENKVKERTDELYQALLKMEHMVGHDPLTGLPNRNVIISYLNEKIKHNGEENKKTALMFIDLDNFKLVNDTMGHDAGDILLKQVSERIRSSIREEDVVARQGGDEFIILLDNVNYDSVIEVAKAIIDSLSIPFDLKGKDFTTSPSIGISVFPDDTRDVEDLIRYADKAMYQSKQKGKNTFQFYSYISEKLNRRMRLESDLRSAINNNEFFLEYQPQFELQTNKLIGVEALLRWKHPELGLINPGEFIPIAESTGYIITIGEWVLKESCKQNKKWLDSGFPSLRIAINISPIQFKDPNFISRIQLILAKTKMSPELLEIEITERIMQNISESKVIITKLKDMGVCVSIDDFGTGYSSLAVLNQLSMDRLKIDRSFVSDIMNNNKTRLLVKTIIEMGNNLDFELIAEGIETVEQKELLLRLGCHYGQGYLFRHPIKGEELFNDVLYPCNDILEFQHFRKI